MIDDKLICIEIEMIYWYDDIVFYVEIYKLFSDVFMISHSLCAKGIYCAQLISYHSYFWSNEYFTVRMGQGLIL